MAPLVRLLGLRWAPNWLTIGALVLVLARNWDDVPKNAAMLAFVFFVFSLRCPAPALRLWTTVIRAYRRPRLILEALRLRTAPNWAIALGLLLTYAYGSHGLLEFLLTVIYVVMFFVAITQPQAPAEDEAEAEPDAGAEPDKRD